MKVSNEMNKSNVLFIFYTRVLAMFFVIIVHLCQENGNVLVRACAQFFITGVTIFIILTMMRQRSKHLLINSVQQRRTGLSVSVWKRLPCHRMIRIIKRLLLHLSKCSNINTTRTAEH